MWTKKTVREILFVLARSLSKYPEALSLFLMTSTQDSVKKNP